MGERRRIIEGTHGGCRGLPLALLLLGSLSACSGGALWRSRQSRPVRAQVTTKQWSRTVHLERFTEATAEGWRDELEGRPAAVMPTHGQDGVPGVDAIRNCRKNQRGIEKIPVGEERVCVPATVLMACGIQEECLVQEPGAGPDDEACEDVTVYCEEEEEDCRMEMRYREEPVYGELCQFTTWRWAPVSSQSAEGVDDAPRWPALAPASDLERALTEQSYSVTFAWTDGGATKRHVETREDAAFYERWALGDAAELDLSDLGTVKHLRKPGEPWSEANGAR
ncbi:MAG: hypothetical protein H6741_00380 [Alphaproteobacteria bacterium]|nr:hypothetical protein [Alphaproteobacteria bacterium]MCB9791160.1 hypothetical protein [Alphaproteobacteria bacterium]